MQVRITLSVCKNLEGKKDKGILGQFAILIKAIVINGIYAMLINFDTKAPLPYNLLCFLLAGFRRQMQDAG